MRYGLFAGAALAFAAITISQPACAQATEVSVTVAGQKFDRDVVTLKVGDALVVKNDDSSDHNLKLTNEDGDPQDLGIQKPGKVVRLTFPNSGSYKLRCSITPDLRMKVVVN
jgi:plastocyanin